MAEADRPVREIECGLDLAVSGYHAWRERPSSQPGEVSQRLVQQITAIHAQSHNTCGSRRVCIELRASGRHRNRERVARLMRLHRVEPKPHRQFETTTQSTHAHRVAANELNRDFNVDAPNRERVADIACVPTREGGLYQAVIMDLFSHEGGGGAMDSRINRELTCRFADSRGHAATWRCAASPFGSW